ncbi:MAG: ParA family protein [Planctomycetota bacterium]
MSAVVLTLYARKGGVGRTMLSQNLAGACAQQGVRVLALDLDPQASLSKNFFGRDYINSLRPYQTIAAMFEQCRDPEFSEMTHQTKVENISIIPSSDHLEPFDLPQPLQLEQQQFVIRDLVDSVREDHEIVLIDTPPNVANLLAWNALMASDYVITPVQPEKNSCEGVVDVKIRLQTAIRNGNSSLVDLGYFINNMDRRTAQHRIMEEELRQLYGTQVFDSVIFRRTDFQNAQHSYRPISFEEPDSPEAEMIQNLMLEIIQRIDAREVREQKRARA